MKREYKWKGKDKNLKISIVVSFVICLYIESFMFTGKEDMVGEKEIRKDK